MAEIETEKLKDKTAGKNGGARPGAGRPTGSQNKETKEKRKAEQEMIQRIVNNLDKILNSQLTLAHGASYLYRIDETGEGKNIKREHVLVTDPDEIKRYLDSQLDDGEELDNYYYITTKTPDGKAIDSLIDRVFGKATQNQNIKINPEENPYDKLTPAERRRKLKLALADLGEEEKPAEPNLSDGGNTELPKDGKDTPGSGAISDKSEERPAQGNPVIAERPPENNGGNDKLDASTTGEQPKP